MALYACSFIDVHRPIDKYRWPQKERAWNVKTKKKKNPHTGIYTSEEILPFRSLRSSVEMQR